MSEEEAKNKKYEENIRYNKNVFISLHVCIRTGVRLGMV